MKCKPFTAEDIARYLIDSPFVMLDQGKYWAYWDQDKGLVYDRTPDSLEACARAAYADGIDRETFDAKESLDDADFMEICAILAHDLNKEIKALYE